VGDDPTPGANSSCIGVFDNSQGKEVSCGLAGRYVTIRRPGMDRICLNGVAVFLDCGSELIWDSLTQPDAPISVGETLQIPLSLATTLETALEANVCGELQLKATNLPSFCTQTGALIECTPKKDTDAGLFSFDVEQLALEHSSSLKKTSIAFEVLALPPVPEPEEIIVINSPPYFEGAP